MFTEKQAWLAKKDKYRVEKEKPFLQVLCPNFIL